MSWNNPKPTYHYDNEVFKGYFIKDLFLEHVIKAGFLFLENVISRFMDIPWHIIR